MKEFKALFGDYNRELVDETVRHPLLFGAEKRGLASVSDLEILLETMGIDTKFMENLSDYTYAYETQAAPMYTVDRKGLLSWTDFRVIMTAGGLESKLPLMVSPDVYGPVNITDLRLALIWLTDDYVDSLPPVIEIIGDNPMELQVGDTFTDPGATATDMEDGDLTGSIVATDNVDTNVEGEYEANYEVTDSYGNTVTETRTVIVSA
jgi:hypothetical protein